MKELKPIAEIRRELRAAMPEAAFRAQPSQLLILFAHLGVVLAGAYGMGRLDGAGWKVLLGLLMGSSIFCVGNMAHYLAHGSVVPGKRLRYVFEYLFFAVTLTPATVFKVVHNQYHHAYTNGRNDTFRCFSEDERTPLRTAVRLLFFPNRHLPWNPMVLVSYNLVLFSQISGAMLGYSGRVSSVIPLIPRYSLRQRLAVWLEMAGIMAFTVALWQLAGADLAASVGLLLAFGTATAISCFYIYIQHDTIDLSEDNHPLHNSMSLTPNRVVDWLHCNLSYHVEHHIFPGLNFRHAPRLAELLHERYPAHYRVHAPLAIWRDLFRNDIYKAPPDAG